MVVTSLVVSNMASMKLSFPASRTFSQWFLLIAGLVILFVLTPEKSVYSLHLTGSWDSSEFFKFLAKFGFQKTDLKSKETTEGFIYGNVTSETNFSYPVTFAVLDRGYFVTYYGNRSVAKKEKACQYMFEKLSKVAYDAHCFDDGEEDFLRKVPCPKGELCLDEDRPHNVVENYQFTYAIQDLSQPRFWYISLVACYRDPTTCEWLPVKDVGILNYDVWLVNGNPYMKERNPLEYQFSFDRQDTVEIYLVFFVFYAVLVPLQVYTVLRQKHPIPRLFTVSIVLEALGVFCNVIHVLKFAFDGDGFQDIAITGDILDILSQTLFMLLLLLLAKGWAITRLELTWKPLVFAIWTLYGVIHILLYIWKLTEVDVIEDIDEYQTWPGWLILVFRTAIMVWFLYELRDTMLYEHNKRKLNFFLHFGASSLVWFIYLPIVALIALQISALWRFKLLLGMTYSADLMAFCVMMHLLWPTRSEQYFLLLSEAQDSDLTEELEEFNEAPHVLNAYSHSPLSPPTPTLTPTPTPTNTFLEPLIVTKKLPT